MHDNLDPQQLGVSPPDTHAHTQAHTHAHNNNSTTNTAMNVKVETWEEAERADPERVETFKNGFRKGWLEDTFSKQLLLKERETNSGKLELDVKTVVEVLSQHCVSIRCC